MTERQTLEEKIAAAQQQLAYLQSRKRKLEDRGRYVAASLILRAADDDPAFATRLHEIVDQGATSTRDRVAVQSVLDRLAEAATQGGEPLSDTPPAPPAADGQDGHQRPPDGHDPERRPEG